MILQSFFFPLFLFFCCAALFFFAGESPGGGGSSHLIHVVRITSSELRGVVREGDIKALENWNCLLVQFRRGAPQSSATTLAAKTGDIRRSREEKEVDDAADHYHRGREAGGGSPSGVAGAGAGDEVAHGDDGDNGEGRGVTGNVIGAEEEVDPLFLSPFLHMLSPVFSFEAAFEALRIEVAGVEDGDDSDIDSMAEVGHLSSRGMGEYRLSMPEAAEAPHNSVFDGARDALGGEKRGLCRSSKAAGLPAVGSDVDDAQRSRWEGVQRRQRREGLVRRRKDSRSAVAEVKWLQLESKTSASKGDDCAAGGDLDTTKARSPSGGGGGVLVRLSDGLFDNFTRRFQRLDKEVKAVANAGVAELPALVGGSEILVTSRPNRRVRG